VRSNTILRYRLAEFFQSSESRFCHEGLSYLKGGLINVCHSVAADTGKMPVLHARDFMSAHNTSPCG
ncbi:MAG: hypothetical protein OJI67_10535, partial [Prosthecobacter sp.]|nr:hypothetical protein [Prosthecobacter sp.]